MGAAKRRKQRSPAWPRAEHHDGTIDLHLLPAADAINGARLRELTGDPSYPDGVQVLLRAFKAVVGERTFHVGFCIGDGEAFSAMGLAVMERLLMEAPGAIHVVPIVHDDIAWDMVMRHLGSFTGRVLLFAFRDSDVYDAGTVPTLHSKHVRQFDETGRLYRRLTDAERREIRMQKARILNRPPPPRLYEMPGVVQEDAPWIFRVGTPSGKVVRAAVWDGRRDYLHDFERDIVRQVGGDRIAIVQVHSPVGVNRRSALQLTHRLAKDFDGVIHWARDTETFQSILRSFVGLDIATVGPPDLPADWEPEITILAANSEAA